MKYIKKFESVDKSKCFWKVRTKDPYFEATLYKLDVPDDLMQMYLRNDFIRQDAGEYIYIAPFQYYGKPNLPNGTSWTKFNDAGKTHYEECGLIYQGEIKITDEDIEYMKMKKNMKKFNL